MTDEELIAVIRSNPWSDGFPYLRQTADRIEELAMLRRTFALEALAAYGQAQDAHEAQLRAEAKLAKVVDALKFYAYVEDDQGFLANTTLAEIEE